MIRNTMLARRTWLLLAASALSSFATGWAAAPAVDLKFTIAVIPDTQNYLDYRNQRSAGYPFDGVEIFYDQMQLPGYAVWYKPREQPGMTDEAFLAEEEFTIELDDFVQRFGRPRHR